MDTVYWPLPSILVPSSANWSASLVVSLIFFFKRIILTLYFIAVPDSVDRSVHHRIDSGDKHGGISLYRPGLHHQLFEGIYDSVCGGLRAISRQDSND